MYLTHISAKTKGKLIFTDRENAAGNFASDTAFQNQMLTIALNGAEDQKVVIDGIEHNFPAFHIIPLVAGQAFTFQKPELITAWQYTRDFYCLVDSYFEISCLGLLFFGFSGNLIIKLDEQYQQKMQGLLQLFIEEFDTVDTIQTDMLQMLLKRLIILTTRLAKEQYLSGKGHEEEKFDIIRQYNLLVDQNFRTQHQVSFYAEQLFKSPKTLNRIFKGFNYSSPSLMIQDRIMMEAKRLFCYTTFSVKEIAFQLGFGDAAHFSRFFKNATGINPSEYRKQI